MPSSFRQSLKSGFQSALMNFRYEDFGRKYSVSHTVAMTIGTREEMAAPATPNGWPVTQPKMRNGASTMFRMTDAVETIMPGLKLPVPRNADPIATIPN